MAKGYPDFFGQSIFPVYGSVTAGDLASAHGGTGTFKELISVTGKGIIREIGLYTTNVGQDGNLYNIIYLTIDATSRIILADWRAERLIDVYTRTGLAEVTYRVYASSAGYMILNQEMPFITSFKLEWYADYTAGIPASTGEILYSLYV